MKLVAAILILTFPYLIWSTFQDLEKYEYKKRGSGESERFEGIKRDKKSGGFELLSFSVNGDEVAFSSNEVVAKFYCTKSATDPIYISIQEIQSQKSYHLDAVKRQQSAGWRNRLVWEKTDVISPMSIDMGGLGVVASADPYGGSGKIYPVMFDGRNTTGKVTHYSIIVKSKFTSSPLVWTLYKSTQGGLKRIDSNSVKRVPASEPYPIRINAQNLMEGLYELHFTSEREGYGQGLGGENIQKRYYEFYHVKNIE
jgi:hypothetical protein